MTDTADSEGRDWDWLDDAGDVIIRGQLPLACYLNPSSGHLSITLLPRTEEHLKAGP